MTAAKRKFIARADINTAEYLKNIKYIKILMIFFIAFLSCKAEFNSPRDPYSRDFINNNARLSGLYVNGLLLPGFDKNIYDYSITVDHSKSAISVIPALEDKKAAVSLNGLSIKSGQPLNDIDLSYGDNNVTIKVTAENKIYQGSYSLKITRLEPDRNTKLASLEISDGVLSPAFDKDISQYSTNVNYSVTSLTIAPIAASDYSKITIDSIPVIPGFESTDISLKIGNNKIIIIVTAEDLVTQNTYIVNVNRRNKCGILVSDKHLIIDEGGKEYASFDVFLTSPPLSNVELDLRAGVAPELDLLVDKSETPKKLIFTPSDYNRKKTVRVRANILAENEIVEGARAIKLAVFEISLVSADSDYNGILFPDINITFVDNDLLPVIIQKIPYNGRRQVPVNQQISVVFSKDMDREFINKNTFMVHRTNESGSEIIEELDGFIIYYQDKRMAVFQNKGYLKYNSYYRVSIASNVMDSEGNECGMDYSFFFMTKLLDPVLAGTYDTSGDSIGIAISGNYAYVTLIESGIEILDISDPVSPIQAGFYDNPEYADDICVSGSYAYVADGSNGLQILDISNPAFPVKAGSYDTLKYASGVHVSGNYVYVKDGKRLNIIDISNPSAPDLKGSYDTPGEIVDLYISGLYAYIAVFKGGIQVLDISAPASPEKVGAYYTTDYASDVFISGNYAYAAFKKSGLHILNIVNPFSPVLTNHIEAVSGKKIYVADKHAYVIGTNCLQILDITDPSSASLSGNFYKFNWGNDLEITGNYVYVVNERNGIQILDLSETTTPSLAGFYDTELAYGICISDNYAFVADGERGLQILDISDPSSPYSISFYDTSDEAIEVFISGDYAYIADNEAGLHIVNIKDPASPSLAGSCDTPGLACGVFVSGNYAFVADFKNGLSVIDISDPSSPKPAGSYNTPDTATGVYISGKYAYVADNSGGLQILDISDPLSPAYISSFENIHLAHKVHIKGNYAYVADVGDGLKIINISDPESPALTGSYDTPHWAVGIYIADNYAYIADFESGLQIIDISDPAEPSLAGSYDTQILAAGVYISKCYAYVADQQNGLQIIHLGPYYEGAPSYKK